MIGSALAFGLPFLAAAAGAALPAPVAQALSAPARLAGEGRLTWWGFAAYDAKLWVAAGFAQRSFDRHPLALELAYLRAFSSDDIARTSLAEIRRAGPIGDAQARRWQEQLSALIPNVAPGDRITGVHHPDRGASFFLNGQPLGTIADTQFSRRFFAIWLGPSSSHPALRTALLGETPP